MAILDFIKQMSALGNITDVFLNGFCYYFAVILQERFGGEILYEPIDGHFVTYINGRYYDVTGDVTDKVQFSTLYTKDVWMRERTIVDGCILKVRRHKID